MSKLILSSPEKVSSLKGKNLLPLSFLRVQDNKTKVTKISPL